MDAPECGYDGADVFRLHVVYGCLNGAIGADKDLCCGHRSASRRLESPQRCFQNGLLSNLDVVGGRSVGLFCALEAGVTKANYV
ncbi:hypothetical protein PEP31012_00877 [Pandoraea eparura]|uniref:Uncharacterized protein n=1 Tax=Pandoraea eparura TaxID=2508291 RepID=A0A5E4SNZ0_9BURK|nr:hypothetical protein PEP31012_00877 [Pandoraea eparura]